MRHRARGDGWVPCTHEAAIITRLGGPQRLASCGRPRAAACSRSDTHANPVHVRRIVCVQRANGVGATRQVRAAAGPGRERSDELAAPLHTVRRGAGVAGVDPGTLRVGRTVEHRLVTRDVGCEHGGVDAAGGAAAAIGPGLDALLVGRAATRWRRGACACQAARWIGRKPHRTFELTGDRRASEDATSLVASSLHRTSALPRRALDILTAPCPPIARRHREARAFAAGYAHRHAIGGLHALALGCRTRVGLSWRIARQTVLIHRRHASRERQQRAEGQQRLKEEVPEMELHGEPGRTARGVPTVTDEHPAGRLRFPCSAPAVDPLPWARDVEIRPIP